MSARRTILLDALEAWRRDGLVDEPTYARLRERVHAEPEPARRGFAADAMQFVGGLLLGAGLVALVVFLDLAERVEPWAFLAVGAPLVALGVAGALRRAAPGLVEAALAGGLVPMLVAVGASFDEGVSLAVPALVALAGIGIVVLRRGEGPSVLVASVAFVWGSARATLLRDDFLMEAPDMTMRSLWLLALLGYGALLVVWREKLWTAISLGLLVAPLTLAFGLLLEPLELESVAMELAIGAFLGALLGVGIWLRSRGLVAGAAAGLTVDAVTFAFDVGGAGTAVVVLLALGGLLVWQAEFVRGYLRGGRS